MNGFFAVCVAGVWVCAVAGGAMGQVPANDACENARLISLVTGCSECVPAGSALFMEKGSTQDATTDGEAPGCGGGGNTSRGVWYTFMGTGHRALLSTNVQVPGTYLDTRLSVYCGSSCAALSCVAYNNDVDDSVPFSELEFCTRNGERYWVLVNGVSTQSGDFGLVFGEVRSGGEPIACCNAVPCSSACEFVIPDGAEGEPGWGPGVTGPGPHDEACASPSYTNATQFNDGCSLAPPIGEDRRYGIINVDQPITGTLWADGNLRDRDWLLFEAMPAGNSLVRYEVSSEGPLLPQHFFNFAIANFDSCSPMLGFALGSMFGCGQRLERVTILDGSSPGRDGVPGHTIGFRMANNASNGYPCGTNSRYWFVLRDVVATEDCPPLAIPPGSLDESTIATFDGEDGSDGFAYGEPCYDTDPDGAGPDGLWRKTGCAAGPFPAGEFLRVVPGTPMRGTMTGRVDGSGATWDTDWYKFSIAERSVVSMRVDSNAPVFAVLTTNTCAPDVATLAAAATRGRCLPDSWIEVSDLVTLDAGTYIVRLNPYDAFVSVGTGFILGNILCGDSVSEYVLSLEATPVSTCGAMCLEGAIVEQEPCVLDADAMFDPCLPENDGCSRVPFTAMALPNAEAGATICGTLYSVYEASIGADPDRGNRFYVDEDYWSLECAVRSRVTFAAAADGPVRVRLLRVGADGALCDAGSAPALAEVDAGMCAAGEEVAVDVGPGVYALAAAPGSVEVGLSYGNYACGKTLSYTLSASVIPACCIGNADAAAPGGVNFADITAVLANFGLSDDSGAGRGDADCDGHVNFADITAVLSNFGSACAE